MHRERKRRRRGVTSTEYAIMLALLLGVMMSSINCLGKTTNAVFTYTEQQMGGGGSDDGN
jgi:Flp pilus assembly pilin Flp